MKPVRNTNQNDEALKRALVETTARNAFASLKRDLMASPAGPEAAAQSVKRSEGFSGRLKFLRDASRLQNNQLAVALGMSEGGFKKWLSGVAEPSLKNLVNIQELTGVAWQWMATGDGPLFPDGPGAPVIVPGFVYIPRYDVRVSAGTGQLVESESLKGMLAFREDWVRSRLRRNPANLVAFEAYGDSMVPTIADGDILLVDISEIRVRGPAIYVVLAGNEAIVKRVELKMDGSLVVKSDNPEYEPYIYGPDRVDELRVLGKVVWTGGVV